MAELVIKMNLNLSDFSSMFIASASTASRWIGVSNTNGMPVPPGSHGNAIFPLKPEGNSLLRDCAVGPGSQAAAALFLPSWSGPEALSVALLAPVSQLLAAWLKLQPPS